MPGGVPHLLHCAGPLPGVRQLVLVLRQLRAQRVVLGPEVRVLKLLRSRAAASAPLTAHSSQACHKPQKHCRLVLCGTLLTCSDSCWCTSLMRATSDAPLESGCSGGGCVLPELPGPLGRAARAACSASARACASCQPPTTADIDPSSEQVSTDSLGEAPTNAPLLWDCIRRD